MGKTVVLAGGNGPERTKIIKKYIDGKLRDGRVVIYDYTYGLISYNKFENVDYFCVDTCLSYIDKLSEILNDKENGDKSKVCIVTDAYGGLMYQGNMTKLFSAFLKCKDEYNVEILMSCRHLEYVPDYLQKLFDEVIEFDDINGVLSNDYFKNLK